MIGSITGVAEALPALEEAIPTPPELNTQFCWYYSGSKDALRGFSQEDAFRLRAWCSDSFDASLEANPLGSHLTMLDRCRGGVVMQKLVNGDSGKSLPLTLTHREVFEITRVRSCCSDFHLLSECIRRENMRRKEQVSLLSKMGFAFSWEYCWVLLRWMTIVEWVPHSNSFLLN